MNTVSWLFAFYVFFPFLWLVSALIVVAIVAVLVTVVVRRQARVSAYSDRVNP